MSRHIRVLSLLAAGSLVAIAPTAAARAQTPDSSKGGLHVRVAGGMDALLFDGSQRIPSLYALTGIEWLHPRAPFSARLDLSYFRRDKEYENPDSFGCTDFCRYGYRHAVLGVSLDGRYTFLGGAPVRPFVASGFGVYQVSRATIANYSCDNSFTCVSTPGQRSTFRDSSFGLGFHAGFGFGIPVGRSELSLEFRLMQQRAGLYPRYNMPVMLGIRF